MRFLTVALRLLKGSEIMDCLCCFGMLVTQALLPDMQGALVEQLRLDVLALLPVQPCQYVERMRYLWMFMTQPLLTDV